MSKILCSAGTSLVKTRSVKTSIVGIFYVAMFLFGHVCSAASVAFNDPNPASHFFDNTNSFSTVSSADIFDLYRQPGAQFGNDEILNVSFDEVYQLLPSFVSSAINPALVSAPGSYVLSSLGLAQSGNAVSAVGGGFNDPLERLDLNVIPLMESGTAPVPEAREWVMILAVLGVIALIARRKSMVR